MRKTIKLNKEILHQMRKIYYSNDKEYIDWMGFKITEENEPSYHHIIKAKTLRDNNKDDVATVENGAYLGKKSHEMLHRIEDIDKDLYDSWNYLFSVINRMRCYPIDDVIKIMYELKQRSINLLNEEKTKERKIL